MRRAVPVSGRRVLALTLLFGGAFSLLLGAVFQAFHHAEAEQHRELARADQGRVLEQAALALRRELAAALADLAYLRQDHDLARWLAEADEAAAARVGEKYLALVRHTGRYARVGFIDAYGWERIGVQRQDGRAAPNPAAGRESRRGSAYFAQALGLPPGQVYLSGLDPDSEAGRPGVWRSAPVIQVAAPVHDRSGLVRGVIALTYRGERLAERLAGLGPVRHDLWVVDRDGRWLLGPGWADAQGSGAAAGEGQGFAGMYPGAWGAMTRLAAGSVEAGGKRLEFRRVQPPFEPEVVDPEVPALAPASGQDYSWTVALPSPSVAESTPGERAEHRVGLAYGALAAFAFAVAGALAFAYVRGRGLTRALEQIVDNLPVLVAYVDADQRYRFNNLTYARTLGVQPDELCGRSVREVLGEPTYARVRPMIEQVLAGQRVVSEARLEIGNGGPRDTAITCVPDLTEAGEVRGFYSVIRDITHLKRAQRRERERILELAHASRLASMGEMATEIAHEVNQPLAAIAMYSAAGLRTLAKGGDTQAVSGWLTAISAESRRIGEVVQRLRKFLQKGDGERGPTDLNEVVREVAGLVAVEAREQEAELTLDLEPGLPAVLADRLLLDQVVLNLVHNALEAVAQQAVPRRVLVRTRSAGDNTVQVSVTDTGPGVSEQLGRSVFDSFVSSKPKGLGMGLAICRSIVEAHEGEIGYSNDPEGGTTFLVTLPGVPR
jgi:PAS domain S-box-containing protein